MEDITKYQSSKVRKLRKSFDLLTNVVVIQFNKINKLLKELEQEN